MTTAYNKTRCAKLVREMRKDDARMTRAPWSLDDEIAVIFAGELEVVVLGEEANNYDGDGPGIERTRNRLRETADQLEAAGERIAALEARQQELLQTIVRLTNETPYPDEVKGWTEQRAKLVAEVGTLRADVAERQRERDATRAELASERKQFVAQVLEHDKVRERFESELASAAAEADRRIAELQVENAALRAAKSADAERVRSAVLEAIEEHAAQRTPPGEHGTSACAIAARAAEQLAGALDR